jgi:imidazolonepropionase-like amidohydrolase
VTNDLVIRQATLVRPPYGPEDARADVVVRDGVIAAITAPSGSRPDSIPVLDAEGRFLMPGLIDAHVHLAGEATPATSFRAYLSAGVTTLREAGASDDAAFDVARRHGRRPPRVMTAGYMLRPSDAHGGQSIAERAETAVRNGATWLKAYSQAPDTVRSVAMTAAKHRLPFAAHLGPEARESVRVADLRAIEHVFTLLEDDLVAVAARDRAAIPPADKPIETWLLSDPTRGALAEWIAELAQRRVTITPTLTVMTALIGRPPHGLDEISACECPWATPAERDHWQERLRTFGWWFTPDAQSRVRRLRVLRRFGDVVLALHDAGCPIAAGTDYGEPFIQAGRGLIEEMRSLRRAGLPLPTVLAAATTVPADLLGKRGVLGDLVVGAEADLIVVDRDPRVSIDALEHVRAVVAAGRVVAGDGPVQGGWSPLPGSTR